MNKKNNIFLKIKNWFKKNILNFIFLFFFLYSLIIIFELYKIQVVKGEYYNEIVLNRNSIQAVDNLTKRGNIFFKNNEGERVAVAIQEYYYSLVIDPTKITKPEIILEKINKFKKIDRQEFFKKVNRKKSRNEVIIPFLTEEEVKKMKIEKIPEVYYIKKAKRKYPFGSVASEIIGFTNFEGRGVYGLEKYYDDILKREKKPAEKNIFKMFFKESKNIFGEKIIFKEGDIVANIDIGLSSEVKKILTKLTEKYQAKYSAAIIIKPDSGKILAMEDSYDLDFNMDKKDYRDIFVEQRFEVGSIFKPLVVGIALDNKAINKNFKFNDLGCIQVKNAKMCNFDKKGRGPGTDLYTILAKSLNTGMVEIGQRIKQDVFLNYVLKLGLSQESGIDLPFEISSSVSNLNNKNKINYATAYFGQGLAFTPIAITRALATLANDGYLVEPHLVEKIDYGNLIPEDIFQPEKEKIFSAPTIKILKDILVKRSDEYGKNKDYFNPNYAVAAKTGTAQIAKKSGGYWENKYIHTFFGFFPAYAKPENRYAIFLYIVEPQGVKYSSESLTEPFYQIVNFMITYFKVRPDRVQIDI